MEGTLQVSSRPGYLRFFLRCKTFVIVKRWNIKVLETMTEWCSGQRVGLISQRSEVRILVQSLYLDNETLRFILPWQLLNVARRFGSTPPRA